MNNYKKIFKSVEESKEEQDPIVTMTVNVKLSHRRYWSGEAKKQGLTLRKIVNDALTEKFGLPEDSEQS